MLCCVNHHLHYPSHSNFQWGQEALEEKIIYVFHLYEDGFQVSETLHFLWAKTIVLISEQNGSEELSFLLRLPINVTMWLLIVETISDDI